VDDVVEVLVFTLAHGPSINMKKKIGRYTGRDYLNGHHLGKNHYDRPIRSSLFLLGLVVKTWLYPSCAHIRVQSRNQCWAIIDFSAQLLVPALGNKLKPSWYLVHQKKRIPVAVLSLVLQLTQKIHLYCVTW
jgi:hypothetical protein